MTNLLIGLLPALIGFLTVRSLEPGLPKLCRHDAFRFTLGCGIGIGLCSECYFAGLVSATSGCALEIVVLIAAGIATASYRGKKACRFCQTTAYPAGEQSFNRWLTCALCFLLLVDLAVFAWMGLRAPRGGWDAWAIWNLRARFFYRGGGIAWRDAFNQEIAWSHPDYPLLLPAFVARGWALIGRESGAVPITVACFFTFGSTALMATSLGLLRSTRQGLLAGLVLAATPFLYVQGALQCSDVPVAFYRLATLSSIAIANRCDKRGPAVLAGAAAALDAWAKNEGLLWFAAFLLACALLGRRRHLPAIFAGALPVLAPILYFKARIAAASDIFGAGGRAGMPARAMDPARYALIAREGLKHIWSFGPLLPGAFVLLTLYLTVAGLRQDQQDRVTLRTGSLALLLTFCGYFLIYLLRSLDLGWLLDTSADRLLLQLWPGIVFVVFLAARSSQDPNAI